MDGFDNLPFYEMVPYSDILERWKAAEEGGARPPWQQPPECGGRVVARLMVLTVGGRIFELNYPEFFRIMLRDGALKLVFEKGREEPILEFYGTEAPRPHTDKEPFGWLRKFTEPKAEPPSNVIPFRKPKA